MCIFCQLVSSETLHFVTAVATGENFYRMANELQIEPLLTYLTFADNGKKGVEEDFKYHNTCKTALYNKFQISLNLNRSSSVSDNSNEAARAFCHLIQHIAAQVEEGQYQFKFPILAKLHQGFRDAVGVEACMNGTVLKDKLADHFKSEASWVKRATGKKIHCVFRPL